MTIVSICAVVVGEDRRLKTNNKQYGKHYHLHHVRLHISSTKYTRGWPTTVLDTGCGRDVSRYLGVRYILLFAFYNKSWMQWVSEGVTLASEWMSGGGFIALHIPLFRYAHVAVSLHYCYHGQSIGGYSNYAMSMSTVFIISKGLSGTWLGNK